MNCIDCGVLITSETRYLDSNRCINCALNYRYCPTCGNFLMRNLMRADMCRPCWRENPTLAGCSCRIDTTPINIGNAPVGEYDRTFGCELEVEVSGRGDPVKKHIREIDELMGDKVLMKRDGSLDNGIEIVTRPAPLKKQYALWNDFFSKKHNGMRSYDTETCGLHIHVGRNGIPDQSETIPKAVCFVNSEANRNFVMLIAGRLSCSYAKMKRKTRNDYNSGDRYEALNVSNSKTIEFRLFRGTLKKESLFKALEFCDSLIQYCSDTKDFDDAINMTKYIKFLKAEKKWPHLLAFIQARWFGIATALSEKAKWSPHNNSKALADYSLMLQE